MIGTKENWADKNSLRDYPLVINSGNFPCGIIIDCFVSIWSDSPVRPCVTAVSVGPGLLSVVFSDAISGNDLFAAVGEVGLENIATVIPSSSVDASGYIKFGGFIPITRSITKYELGSVMLLEHCYVNFGNHIVPWAKTQGLDRDILRDLSLSVSGDLKIDSYVVQSDVVGEETVLEFSLNNAGRYKEKCAPPTTICECENLPIKQINTVFPDDTNRNINIVSSSDILQIIAGELGITISALAPTKQICPPTNLPQPDGKLKGEI